MRGGRFDFDSHPVHCKQPRVSCFATLLCAQAKSASYPQQDRSEY